MKTAMLRWMSVVGVGRFVNDVVLGLVNKKCVIFVV